MIDTFDVEDEEDLWPLDTPYPISQLIGTPDSLCGCSKPGGPVNVSDPEVQNHPELSVRILNSVRSCSIIAATPPKGTE